MEESLEEMPNFTRVKENFMKRIASERRSQQRSSVGEREREGQRERQRQRDDLSRSHSQQQEASPSSRGKKKSSGRYSKGKIERDNSLSSSPDKRAEGAMSSPTLEELVAIDQIHAARKSLHHNKHLDSDSQKYRTSKKSELLMEQRTLPNEESVNCSSSAFRPSISPVLFPSYSRQNSEKLSPFDVNISSRFKINGGEDDDVCIIGDDEDYNRQDKSNTSSYEDLISQATGDSLSEDSDSDSDENSSPSLNSEDEMLTESDEEKHPSCGGNDSTGDSSLSSDNNSSSCETTLLSFRDEDFDIGGKLSVKDDRYQSPLSINSISPSISHSRSLLCQLLRMQSLSGKGPLCSQFGRTLSPRHREHGASTGDTFYCSGSAESLIAEAVAGGNLKSFLKAQIDMLLHMKAMLPQEDGENFLSGGSAHRSSSNGDSTDDLTNPFHGNAISEIIALISDTITSIDTSKGVRDGVDNDKRIFATMSKKPSRYSGCNDVNSSSDGCSHEQCDDSKKLCAQLNVSLLSLSMLALTGRILRAEQRIVALRRLHHQKSSRLTECEDKLLESMDKSRQSQLEIDQLKLRVGSLQESLNYHRIAAERIQILEESLARTESERQSVLNELESAEQQLKMNAYESFSRPLRNTNARPNHSAVRHTTAQVERGRIISAIYSDDDSADEDSFFDRRDALNSHRSNVASNRDAFSHRDWQLRADSKEISNGDFDFGHKRVENNDHTTSLAGFVDKLHAASQKDVESFYSKFSDGDLTKLTYALASISTKVEEAKILSMFKKEKELAESKSSNAENNLCCICRDATKNILLLPCRHLCLCEECSDSLREHDGSCPVCREVVRDTLRVYA